MQNAKCPWAKGPSPESQDTDPTGSICTHLKTKRPPNSSLGGAGVDSYQDENDKGEELLTTEITQNIFSKTAMSQER